MYAVASCRKHIVVVDSSRQKDNKRTPASHDHEPGCDTNVHEFLCCAVKKAQRHVQPAAEKVLLLLLVVVVRARLPPSTRCLPHLNQPCSQVDDCSVQCRADRVVLLTNNTRSIKRSSSSTLHHRPSTAAAGAACSRLVGAVCCRCWCCCECWSGEGGAACCAAWRVAAGGEGEGQLARPAVLNMPAGQQEACQLHNKRQNRQ
jgi:hypothetical protein